MYITRVDSVEFDDDDYADILHLAAIQKYFDTYQSILPAILINDSYYCDKDMFLVKDWLNKVGGKVSDYSEEQHFKNFDEILQKFAVLFPGEGFIDWIAKIAGNTKRLTEACNFSIPTSPAKLPRYEFAETSNEELFFSLIEQGFAQKIQGRVSDEALYLERVEIEAEVIVNAGLIDYFLIIWDIIKYARDRNIIVGAGRGSIAGSLIAYLLNLTDVDPIKYDLLFERFLNATRATHSLPDVDTDFPAQYRDEIKEYIRQRFGESHVCSIGSYTRLKLKAGLKDFARVKGLKFSYVNFITNAIDHQLEYTFDDFVRFALESNDLQKFFQLYPDIIHCIKDALGQCRAASIHASAVVIVPKQDFEGNEVDIFDWLPIRKIQGRLVSEWEGKYIEKAGFLKEDILGLTQLDKFKTMLALIKRNHKQDVILPDIPLDDVGTFKLFHKGYNEDVFQFTSAGLKNYSINVKPDHIEDLIAMSALYRPGPMGSKAHETFALIKHGKQKPKYDYGLKTVTEKTHGVYVYQEQIMQAVVVLGGMSLIESDNFRQAIKKFDRKTMATYEEKFIQGAINNGCPPKEAKFIWDKLLKFSGYGFNKSHSAAYSIISYHCQWLKRHYPLEFWTASLQHAHDYDIPNRISEMKKLKQGITIQPPDINKSATVFTCDKASKNIYWSLVKIKQIGAKTAYKIIKERQTNGKYQSFEEFVSRAKVGKGIVYNLIIAGAFDRVEGLHTPMERVKVLEKWCKIYDEQIAPSFYSPKAQTMTAWVLMAKSLTGLGDLDYRALIVKKDKALARKYMDMEQFAKAAKYAECVIAGQVLFANERTGKKAGKYMALTLSCNNEIIIVTFWNPEYETHKEDLRNVKGKLLAISGKVFADNYYNQNVLYAQEDTQIIEI
jgi:DNA polymerase-3 subunit alpha